MDNYQTKGNSPTHNGLSPDLTQLERELLQQDWLTPAVLAKVESTNRYVEQNLEKIAPGKGLIVVADEQTQGRGRLDREWITSFGGGVAMSIGINVTDLQVELSAVPLITGLAAHRALASFGVKSSLKWPNDIIFDDLKSGGINNQSGKVRKVGGILVQLISGNLIIGVGINVGLTVENLPNTSATSLKVEGYDISRSDLIKRLVAEIQLFRSESKCWLSAYKAVCSTLNKNVHVTNFGGVELSGQVVDITESGALVLKNLENLYQITVGDIEHFSIVPH